MAKQFKLVEETFDTVVSICVSLTNYHCTLMPLCEADTEFYKTILAKLRAIANSWTMKRKLSLQK